MRFFVPSILLIGTAASAAVEKRLESGGTCTKHVRTSGYYTDFTVTLWGDTNNWLGNYGGGFLDNLRGECAKEILDWTFNYINFNTKGTATFTITGPRDHCVEDAAWDASLGTLWGLTCVDV